MAHLWLHDGDEDRWAVVPLEGDGFQLSGTSSEIHLLPTPSAGGLNWVLLAGVDTEVAINGLRLKSGIRVLSDRDEISIAGRETYYFSTETLAAVQTFAGADRRLFCPRCKDEIAPGDASVKCPQCRLIHHQSEDRPCWTYAETCAACAQRSDLQHGYRWTPDGL